MVSDIFYFHPPTWGKCSNLTNYFFFKWVLKPQTRKNKRGDFIDFFKAEQKEPKTWGKIRSQVRRANIFHDGWWFSKAFHNLFSDWYLSDFNQKNSKSKFPDKYRYCVFSMNSPKLGKVFLFLHTSQKTPKTFPPVGPLENSIDLIL